MILRDEEVMAKDRKNESGTDKNKVREPEATLKTFRAFDSFKDMKEDELGWLAALTPEQHLGHTISLIKRVYADKLARNPKIGKKLYFE